MRTLAALIILSFPLAHAQQRPQNNQVTGPEAPLASLPGTGQPGNSAASAPLDGSALQNGNSNITTQPQPDQHVLASAETLGLGSLQGLRRFFDPALKISEFDETGLIPHVDTSVTTAAGSLDADQQWGAYHLVVAYNGSEVRYQPSYLGHHYLPSQSLSLSPEIISGRWTLRLRNDALYSWESGFGGLFTGGPQSAPLSNLQPSLSSNGVILTGLARQLNNMSVAELDYELSHRTTVTFEASYGILHFFQTGYINSRSLDGRVGYNYALSAANSISLTYDYNQFNYSGSGSRLQTNLVQMSFGRKITGRLAFQVGAGPEILITRNLGPSNSPQVSWSGSGSLTYKRPRTGYALSYFRGTSAGSGVFFGSTNQTFTGSMNHDFTRFWSASINGGYARSDSLVRFTNLASRFQNWFAGAQVERQIGREIRLDLNYSFQQQTSSNGLCPVLACSPVGTGTIRQVGVTLQWHPLTPRSR